ncbi:MAG: hypothetical protein KDD44_13920, partial [Bdellovibrionales bacterium]|nr:hypothetical protein [Bdellovibrionales bacterium]
RLVLSQFTFFNQNGVSQPTGETFRRGRRCYRLPDVLPIACVLALKEEGIPLKNLSGLPELIRENVEAIFSRGSSCRIAGFGETISLRFAGQEAPAVTEFLENSDRSLLCWSFDIGELAQQLLELAYSQLPGIRKAA